MTPYEDVAKKRMLELHGQLANAVAEERWNDVNDIAFSMWKVSSQFVFADHILTQASRTSVAINRARRLGVSLEPGERCGCGEDCVHPDHKLQPEDMQSRGSMISMISLDELHPSL